MSPHCQSIDDIVAHIKRSSPFWAPEVKAANLHPYLQEHGKPLYDALMALPEDERKVTGVDRFVERRVS